MFTSKKGEKRKGSKGAAPPSPPPPLTPPDISQEMDDIDEYAVDQSTYCETPTNGGAKVEDHYGFLYTAGEKEHH